MLEAIQRIYSYTENISENEFLTNNLIQDAVVRNIEILGEAAHNIEVYHREFAEKHPDVPWGDIYLMRNSVSHGYFATDYEIIWRTVETDLPPLELQLTKILQELESN